LGKQRKAPWLTKENNIGEMADNVGLTESVSRTKKALSPLAMDEG